jgi:hypothetical protein
MTHPNIHCIALAAAWLGLWLPFVCAHAVDAPVRGQLLYVPAYSEVPFGDKGLTLNLTATLSIRNTDPRNPIAITKVDYYSASGAFLHHYQNRPTVIKPLATLEHVVRESDRSGGTSASFLVEWESQTAVAPPYLEAIMVNSTYNQGIAFTSQARVLEEKP